MVKLWHILTYHLIQWKIHEVLSLVEEALSLLMSAPEKKHAHLSCKAQEKLLVNTGVVLGNIPMLKSCTTITMP